VSIKPAAAQEGDSSADRRRVAVRLTTPPTIFPDNPLYQKNNRNASLFALFVVPVVLHIFVWPGNNVNSIGHDRAVVMAAIDGNIPVHNNI
jgi:hypothetical protein